MSENTQQKVIKNKIDLLKLAETLGSVSRACKVMGFSRPSFYRFRELYETGGALALQEVSRRRPIVKNRVAQAVEKTILALAVEKPTLGQVRVSNELKKQGLLVSPRGVREVWLRYDLETSCKRLRALEAKSVQDCLILTEAQVRALERAKEERAAHGEIETVRPGCLGAQATYYVGLIKGVGRIYQQTFVDTYSKVAFAKLYDRKNTLAADDLLNDRVLPFFEGNNVPLLRLVTDRGMEYHGARERHKYQRYLSLEDIDHRHPKTRRPQTDRVCERFHKTLHDDFYSTAFRKTLYRSLEQLQGDLDRWLEDYNRERPHSGKYCFGKTPMQTFMDSRQLALDAILDRDALVDLTLVS